MHLREISRARLILVEVAVLSKTAVIRIFGEGHIRQLFQKSNAHDTSAFNASLVRHKRCVRNTHRPRVENSSARRLCATHGGSQTWGRALTFDQAFVQYVHAVFPNKRVVARPSVHSCLRTHLFACFDRPRGAGCTTVAFSGVRSARSSSKRSYAEKRGVDNLLHV